MTKYMIVCGIMNVSVGLVSIGLWGLYTTLRMNGNQTILFPRAPAHWVSLNKPQTTRETFQTHPLKSFIPWT